MSQLFSRLQTQAFRAGITPRSKESRRWFANKAKNLGNIRPEKAMKEDPLVQRSKHIIGSMQMFTYDPKHKETLPYYDTFPLAIIIGPAPGGFYGLNLHYLPPQLRLRFLDNLMDIQEGPMTERTKFNLTYEFLKKSSKLRYFQPCLKHYLSDHVTSNFAEVLAPEWEIAIFLPTAQFRKRNSKKVYYDSRQIINAV